MRIRPSTARFRTLGVLTLAATLLAACGNGGGESDDGTFDILLIAGVTGPTAGPVENVVLGLETAIEAVNSDGGINGKQIKLEVLDSKADPTQAVSQLQKVLASGDKPDLVWPGVSSPESLALLPVLTDEKIWSFGQTASPLINDPKKYPYHFGISVDKNNEWMAAALEPMKKLAPKTVGMLTPSDAFGDAAEAAVKAVTDEVGAELVVERFDPTGLDYTVQYSRVLSKNPDVVVLDTTGGDPTPRLFAAREAADGLDTPIWIAQGVTGAQPPKTVATPEQLENCEMPSVFAYTVRPESVPEKIAPLADTIESDHPGLSIYAPGLAYDLVRIAALAAEQSEGYGGEEMAKAMLALDVPDDYSVVYGGDLKYTNETHFPVPPDNLFSMMPCSVELTDDGFFAAPE